MEPEIIQSINNILYSCHILIMAKGKMENYPFYSYEEGKWLIQAMKVNIDKDWSKEMRGLLIYVDDILVFSKGYKTWVSRNYLPISDTFLPGKWIEELFILRNKAVNQLRIEELEKNRNMLLILNKHES